MRCALCVKSFFLQLFSSFAADLFVTTLGFSPSNLCDEMCVQLFHDNYSIHVFFLKSPSLFVQRLKLEQQGTGCYIQICPRFCPPDDGYVLLHVPAEYLGGGVRRGQTRHPHPQ